MQVNVGDKVIYSKYAGTDAVSYTHLDVYKRQQQNSGFDQRISHKRSVPFVSTDMETFCGKPYDAGAI